MGLVISCPDTKISKEMVFGVYLNKIQIRKTAQQNTDMSAACLNNKKTVLRHGISQVLTLHKW